MDIPASVLARSLHGLADRPDVWRRRLLLRSRGQRGPGERLRAEHEAENQLLRVISRRNLHGVDVRIRFRVCDDSEEIRLRATRRFRYSEDAPVTDREISGWLLHRRNATRPRCGSYHAAFQVWDDDPTPSCLLRRHGEGRR